MDFKESDWQPERSLVLGPLRLQVWPARDDKVVQSQWAAVEMWVAMRSTSLDLTSNQKQKARHSLEIGVRSFKFRYCFALIVRGFVWGLFVQGSKRQGQF